VLSFERLDESLGYTRANTVCFASEGYESATVGISDLLGALEEMQRDATAKALATAKAERLTLKTSKNGTGYKGVRFQHANRGRNPGNAVRFQAQKKVDDKMISLGNFSTAAEAPRC